MGVELPVIDVDLARPPSERWDGLRPFGAAMRELTEMFERDLMLARPFREMVALYRDQQAPELRAELEAIATDAQIDPLDLFLVNAYYDVFKHAMACTAVAIEGADGPVHARNLDWHSENRALERHSVLVRYRRRDALLFESVSWPGFIGTLSGVAPGRFAVTLNAVLSSDPPQVATPISFVLRELLAEASYAEAVASLSKRTLTGDCLLLVTGTEQGEMTVIERAPTRSAKRGAEGGVLTVTNDYKVLDGDAHPAGALAATSCGRFDRARSRLVAERPADAAALLDVLSDGAVRMSITVQQMVLSARRGVLAARRPPER